jgi:hypothetical protein
MYLYALECQTFRKDFLLLYLLLALPFVGFSFLRQVILVWDFIERSDFQAKVLALRPTPNLEGQSPNYYSYMNNTTLCSMTIVYMLISCCTHHTYNAWLVSKCYHQPEMIDLLLHEEFNMCYLYNFCRGINPSTHVKWVSCYYSMAHPQLVDRGDWSRYGG